MNQQAALVVGVGERQGIGAAVAVKAAAEGMHVFIAGRTDAKLKSIVTEIEAAGGKATAVVTDSTEAGDIDRLFGRIIDTNLSLGLVVYNTGRNIPLPFMESDIALMEGHWRRCVLGGLLVGQAALRIMLEQEPIDGKRGSIIYTGASASLRGKPLFAGFSAAKGALRTMAQSMAREFGPQGIHIGHVVIDGIVDGAIVRSFGLGRLLLNQKGDSGALKPDEVAKSFWMLHQQARTAWTHELDLRPWKESF